MKYFHENNAEVVLLLKPVYKEMNLSENKQMIKKKFL